MADTMNFGVNLLPTQDNTYSFREMLIISGKIFMLQILILKLILEAVIIQILYLPVVMMVIFYKHSNFRVYQRTSGGTRWNINWR